MKRWTLVGTFYGSKRFRMQSHLKKLFKENFQITNPQIEMYTKEAFKSLTSFSGLFQEKKKRREAVDIGLSDKPLDAESEIVFKIFDFELGVGQKRV